MSRIGATGTIETTPGNNIYTGLAAAACVVVILGLLALYFRADELGIALF